MKAQLTQGNVSKTLLQLTIPMIWGVFAVIFFNLVDTYFVGKLGITQLAAMSFTFPVVMILGSMAIGLGIGASSVIARAIGEGNTDRVKYLTTNSLLLSILIVGVAVIIGLATIDPIFTILGADEETLPLIREYMTIWYLGMICLVVPMVGNSAIRASGDTLTPSIIMMIAGFINIILDPIFIFGWGFIPSLGLKGAALTTVISRAITLVASIYLLHFRLNLITWKLPHPRQAWRCWQSILAVGIPAAGTNMISPISIAIVTSLIATYNPEAVAGFGVATRIESFSIIGLMALSAGIGPFVGQNWGAKEYQRVREALNISINLCVAWGVFISIPLVIAAPNVAKLFNPDPQVVQVASMYLRLVSISYIGYGVILVSSAVFNALGKPTSSLVLIVSRMLVLYLPLAYLGSWLLGLKGIFLAATFANLVVGVMAFFLERKISPPNSPHKARFLTFR